MVDETKIENVDKHGGFRFSHIFIVIGLILVFFALLSHNSEDFSVIDGGMPGPVLNWIGPAGAYFSCTVLYFFGVAAYPILFFLAICFLRPLLKIPFSRRGFLGSAIAVVIGITIIFGMFPDSFCFITDYLGIGSRAVPSSALSGGVIGQKLAAPLASRGPGLITGFIGTVGTFVVGMVFLVSGLVFVWLCDWQSVLKAYIEERKIKILLDNPVGELREIRLKEQEEKIQEMKKKKEAELKQKELEKAAVAVAQAEKEKEKEKEEKEEDEEEKKNPKVVIPQVSKKIQTYGNIDYALPPLSLLEKGKEVVGESLDIITASKKILQATLDSFKIDGQVVDHVTGPRVTRFEISLSPGVKVDKVTGIANNISMEMQAESIRIQAPIPGKNTIGIEVPNSTIATIPLRAIMDSEAWKNSKAEVPVILGKDVSGKISILDLTRAPHLLIAGATGSGKSVCIHTIILSLLYRFSPFDMKIIMVDPKMVEFNYYSTLPHLITPVVTSPKKVPAALHWAVNEMERRYKIFSQLKARNLHSFNNRPVSNDVLLDEYGNPIQQKMPYLVIIIDELADIMMTDAKSDVEICIARIAQKGRAAGIHMIVATQTPRVTIITGVIKANMPTRIALQVSSIVDSKVIIDGKGAEKLLGKGDMLIIPPGSSNLERIQGTWVSDREIEKVVLFVSDQVEQDFDNNVLTTETVPASEGDSLFPDMDSSAKFAKYWEDGDDDLIKQAIEVILMDGKASTSYLQRKLKVGYNKAAELIEELEHRGLVGPAIGASAKREILVEIDGKRPAQDDED